MISDDELAQLEGLEPEQKFCRYERMVWKKLQEARLNASPNQSVEFDEYDYAVEVIAAAKEFGIDELLNFELPWPDDQGSHEMCRKFRADANVVSTRIRLRYGIPDKSVALNPATKEKISHWINKLRELVQRADVSDEKKDRLFILINNLQAEVDRERTPVQAVGDLWIEVCTYIGKGFEELRPMAEFVDRIGVAIGIAKDDEEVQRRLPKRKDQKRIEDSTKDKQPADVDLDDEIPF